MLDQDAYEAECKYERQYGFFVRTNKRTEYFATREAALLFIDLHCNLRRRRDAERVVQSNIN